MRRLTDKQSARIRQRMLSVGSDGWRPKSRDRERFATIAIDRMKWFDKNRPDATAKEVKKDVTSKLRREVGFSWIALYYAIRIAWIAYQWWKARQENALSTLWETTA